MALNKRDSDLRDKFKKGSQTFFSPSIFFDKPVRIAIYKLYAFMRTADDFVDSLNQDREGFYRFRDAYRRALRSEQPSGDRVIDAFIEVSRDAKFPAEWAESFFKSMEMDIDKKNYQTLDETLEYIFGSAEVVGLFMAKILDLPEESFPSAQMMGRSMQYLNIIRDIAEDLIFGRIYLPLEGSGFSDLREITVRKDPEGFIRFIRKQIERYRSWKKEAEKGFAYIPRRALIPIKTASDTYFRISETIYQKPFIVYQKKVRSSHGRILASVFWNTLTLRG